MLDQIRSADATQLLIIIAMIASIMLIITHLLKNSELKEYEVKGDDKLIYSWIYCSLQDFVPPWFKRLEEHRRLDFGSVNGKAFVDICNDDGSKYRFYDGDRIFLEITKDSWTVYSTHE